ncbi:DUF5819 family protein [Aeromicrobium sp.]
MENPEPSSHATAIPRVSRRVVILVIAVLAALHSFLVMIWVMPENPIRDAVGRERLSSYINPYFEQSWSVFAPTPKKGGESVVIRAFIGKPGSKDGKVTEWYDITAEEDARVEYLVNPSRFHSATHRLGNSVNTAMAKYTPVQRRVVGANFVKTPRSELRKLLLQTNRAGVVGQQAVLAYLQQDEMLTRFGTMYATTRWGKGVSMVEFKVGHRNVPNFSQRNEIDFRDVPFTYYLIGWRKAMPGGSDAQTAFDGYVKKAPAKKSTTKGGK